MTGEYLTQATPRGSAALFAVKLCFTETQTTSLRLCRRFTRTGGIAALTNFKSTLEKHSFSANRRE
jgi:hypothetical protein